MSPRRTGVVYALCAFVLWGLLPAYLKLLHSVSAVEVVGHRVVWLGVFLIPILSLRHGWSALGRALGERKTVLLSATTAAILSVNWFVYVWAVDAERIVDASLGYFINPLVNVVLGVVFLGERLRKLQWLALVAATFGVLWLAFPLGEPPWIGLLLGSSFGTYGLLRKTAKLPSLEGLALETSLLLPFALALLGWSILHGQSGFVNSDMSMRALLMFAGPATGIPLLFFAAGAQRIPLSTLGVLQYVGPTLQLFLGVVIFGEPFSLAKAGGYCMIWLGLALYAIEGVVVSRRE